MLPNVLQPSATDHVPVLANEVRESLGVQPGETVVDATFGAGGHAALLAGDLQGRGKLIAIDRDPTARTYFERFEKQSGGVQARLLRGDFSLVLPQLAENGVQADAILSRQGQVNATAIAIGNEILRRTPTSLVALSSRPGCWLPACADHESACGSRSVGSRACESPPSPGYHAPARAVSSAGRAPALQAGSRRFEPVTAHSTFANLREAPYRSAGSRCVVHRTGGPATHR